MTELLAKASRSLLEVWGEEMFRNEGTALEVLGQRLVVLNRPQAIEALLLAQADGFAEKPAFVRKLLAPLMGEGLFLADPAAWPPRRRAVIAAAGPGEGPGEGPLAGLEGIAQGWAMDWARQPEGQSIELMGAMDRCAVECLGRCLFGLDIPREAAAEMARLADAYRGKIEGAGLIALLALPEPIVRLRLRGPARRIHALLDGWVAQAVRAGGNPVARLAEAPGMTPDRLREEVASLFAKGHAALAGLLASAWFLLSQAPGAEAALHAELSETLAGRAVAANDLERLPMTRAILLEALRLYPPIPLFGRVAAGDAQLAGETLPKGSLALVAPWVLHRHQAHWDAPDAFRPERFLPGAPAPKPFTYLPFGLGPRRCPGEEMALRAAMLLLGSWAQSFRLHLPAGDIPIPRAGLTLRLAMALPMRLERR